MKIKTKNTTTTVKKTKTENVTQPKRYHGTGKTTGISMHRCWLHAFKKFGTKNADAIAKFMVSEFPDRPNGKIRFPAITPYMVKWHLRGGYPDWNKPKTEKQIKQLKMQKAA